MTRVDIRPLRSLEERRECVALQEETWGAGFADRVPASILMVAQETGGVASGAFEGGRLVGFVFGITGLRGGRPTHWSDMLAVRPDHRGRGTGTALKWHQRDLLLARGVGEAVWTFDPLVARNAHLNLNRLGAVVREYRRNLYGESDSPLHAGLGTDRLLAEWRIESERVQSRVRRGAEAVAPEPVRLINPPRSGAALPRPPEHVAEPVEPRVGIVVPSDLEAVRGADPELALAWRRNVRVAFERCLEAGYVAVGLRKERDTAAYVLTRDFDW